MKCVIILFFLFSSAVHAELLNKIIAVFDDQIITLAQANRVIETLKARKTISPLYGAKETFTLAEIARIQIDSFLIRDKLAEMGYIIDDNQVESQIKDTEKRLNLNREALLQFLNSNNMTFEEYFELVRQSIEHNIFNGRVVEPLVTITDQEIKNTFYKKNAADKTFTFKYALEDFYLKKDLINSSQLSELVLAVKNQKTGGSVPPGFASLANSNLGNVTEDTLSPELNTLLKTTNEGEFTGALLIGDFYHVFYVEKKDLVESEVFNLAKDKIKMELYLKKSEEVVKLWMESEASKHFVKYYSTE
jgi:peptidyl-prolyl cis-trans isomerase SurA